MHNVVCHGLAEIIKDFPEKQIFCHVLTQNLYMGKMVALFIYVSFLYVAFVDAATNHVDLQHRTMSVYNTMLPEGPKLTTIQDWFQPCLFHT